MLNAISSVTRTGTGSPQSDAGAKTPLARGCDGLLIEAEAGIQRLHHAVENPEPPSRSISVASATALRRAVIGGRKRWGHRCRNGNERFGLRRDRGRLDGNGWRLGRRDGTLLEPTQPCIGEQQASRLRFSHRPMLESLHYFVAPSSASTARSTLTGGISADWRPATDSHAPVWLMH